ncbi:MAG TPA: hypothetical protein VN714_19735 [Trebonia sp.]|nr:hypothetical protein [Trebonia sp.]
MPRPQPEEVLVSFSEPGRDDGNLPPVNIVIPDDARELDRDVLAYRREQRAQRRRQRLLRVLRPFRLSEFGGHTAIIPLIAACLAISLVGGALLSVATMSPASAPTLAGPPTSPLPSTQPVISPADLHPLPAGTVQLNGGAVQVRSLVSATIAIVPVNCGCSAALDRLASQAVNADTDLYFAAAGAEISQLPALTSRYGHGAAIAVADNDGVLSRRYQPVGLTVLLVFRDATAAAVRNLSGGFELTSVLRELKLPGTSLSKA